MKQTWKRLAAFVMAAAMALSLLPAPVLAAETAPEIPDETSIVEAADASEIDAEPAPAEDQPASDEGVADPPQNGEDSDPSEPELDTPKLQSVKNVANGIQITWGKVDGAAQYRVFYKTGSSGWKKAGDTTATSYVWKKAKSKTTYSFTVRCLSGDGSTFTSQYDKTGLRITAFILKASAVQSAKIVATNTARIQWSKSAGADGYLIYRRTSKKWAKIASVTGANQTYCYDRKVKKNQTYYYTVKAYQKINGKTTSAKWSTTGKKFKFKNVTVNPKSGDFSAGTVYGPKLNAKQRKQVRSAVNGFFNHYITSDMNTISKIFVAQAYMDVTCDYAADWSKNGANTAWGALVYKNKYGQHEAQCSGYARGFKALCDAMGVPCRYVHANKKSANPSHQWCMVKVSGKWYMIDPQGNSDSSDYFFFLVSGSDYSDMTGMDWDRKSYPTTAKNSYDVDKINKAIDNYAVWAALQRLPVN